MAFACTIFKPKSQMKPIKSAESPLVACNSIPKNFNDLRAVLNGEWDVMPQQTMSTCEQLETLLLSCN